MPAHTTKVIFDTEAEDKPYIIVNKDAFLAMYTGMRGRMCLDENEGMLFQMDREDDHVFWMKDVHLSLDIIFISRNNVVVGVVENATPMTECPLSCGALSWNVIETSAGFCSKNEIKKGTRVLYQGLAP
jgi:uncharacterized membrane protein (UPF0127 family)